MMYHSHVLVCAGTGCTSSNSLQIIENFHIVRRHVAIVNTRGIYHHDGAGRCSG